MKPLIYIAGPYTSDPTRNTRNAIETGLNIRNELDVAVIIPHLTLLADLVCPQELDYWYQFDLDQIAHCSALYRMPGPSIGADAEVARAHELQVPVFMSRVDLNEWVYRQ